MSEIDFYIEKYGRRLYGLCRHLIGEADADDLYQETWLRAYMKLGTYKREAPFEPWITKICVNAYRDELRRKSRRASHELECEEKDALIEGAGNSDEVRAVEVRDAVAKLPSKLREAVVLYYFNGYDEKTTARLLRVPVGTVKSRLSAAKIKLKGALGDEF